MTRDRNSTRKIILDQQKVSSELGKTSESKIQLFTGDQDAFHVVLAWTRHRPCSVGPVCSCQRCPCHAGIGGWSIQGDPEQASQTPALWSPPHRTPARLLAHAWALAPGKETQCRCALHPGGGGFGIRPTLCTHTLSNGLRSGLFWKHVWESRAEKDELPQLRPWPQ